MMNHEDRIVRDPQICGGEPVFRGTRVTLRTVLASLAAGDGLEAILAEFPALKPEDVRAAIAIAAASAGEDLTIPAHATRPMRIKLDENLPASLATIRAGLSHDVHTVAQEGLHGSSDRKVWDAAQRNERFLITQDLDFSDLRQFTPGTRHGILLVRLRTPDRQHLIQRVRQIFEYEDVAGWGRCFVVATEHKTRVLRPPVDATSQAR